ncbi:MAG: glycosyltransferase [Pseudomonadota bacterium]
MIPGVPVSVVVPCYCCAATLGRAVDSVISQTMPPLEIILVDDGNMGSTRDEILRIQETHGREGVRVIRFDCNQGPSAARNAGWDAAGGEYVAFLDSDDTWVARKLEHQYGVMKTNPGIALSGSPGLRVGGKPGPAAGGVGAGSAPEAVSVWQLLISNRFRTSSVMVRTDLPLRFNTEKRFSEDYLLWLEILLDGYPAVWINEPLVMVHKPSYGSSGLSQDLTDMEKGELDVFFRLLRQRRISAPVAMAAMGLSLIKYCRRIYLLALGIEK